MRHQPIRTVGIEKVVQMSGWMEGIKVLDLSWGMAGPLATMWLCDYGAEVIRVEPPEGDPWWSEPGSLLWNRGKKGVTLDLKSRDGQEAVRSLAARSDVLVECFRPGEAEELGIGYEQLCPLNDRLVYCAIPAFGSRGPYRDWPQYEEVVAAKVGVMAAIIGWFADRPVYKGLRLGGYGAAALALQGILAALHVREKTGRGQQIEASLLAGLVSYQGMRARYEDEARNAEARSRALWQRYDPRHTNPGVRMAECGDGKWIQLGAAQNDFFLRLLLCLGLEEETKDPRFSTWPKPISENNGWELVYKIEDRLKTQTRDYWTRLFEERDVPYAIPATTEELLDNPQARHLGVVAEVDDPRVGRTEQLGKWFETGGGDWRIKGPAPLPGAHNTEVLASLENAPLAATAPSSVSAGGTVGKPPLEGIVILDLSNWIAAPIGVRYLADLGAEVIKIEQPSGSPLRGIASDTALWAERGKRAMVVNLKPSKGQEIIHKLVERADVILHNMRPNVPERLGIDYETLKAINPRLIYCYASSWGSTGPYAHRPAYGPLIAATSGSEVAQAGEGNPPQYLNEGDPTAALGIPVAVLMALYQRDRTGTGQLVETRMLVSEAYLNSEDAIRYAGKPKRRLADKNQLGLEALYRLYEAKDSTWVFLACQTDDEWRALCEAVGFEKLLTDPRFATKDGRREHSGDLAAVLEPLFRQRGAAEWESLLVPAGVGCVVADRHFLDVFYDDPHYRDNEMVIEMEHPTIGRYWQPGVLVRFSETPGRILRSASSMGEQTDEILAELGYGPADISDLRAEGVVA